MVDPFTLEIWLKRLLLACVITFMIFLKLLPLQSGGSTLPGPDLILCFMAAWAIRRPALVSLGMVVIVGLVTDFLFIRAPGVWTIILILSFEALRVQARREGTMSFASEMGIILAVFTSAFIANRLILLAFGVAQPPLGATVLELFVSLLFYPLVALITVFIFRVRHPDPTDLQGLRGRG